MGKSEHNLLRFVITTFMFSWLIWLPAVLVSYGLFSIPEDRIKMITMPLAGIGVFGPMTGALLAIRRELGKGAIKEYLKSFLDFRLGWKVYVLPFLILGLSTFGAWVIPEWFGEERLPMLTPSIWVFPPYLVLMILIGGGQEEIGWRGYAMSRLEDSLGLWLGNLLLGIIWAVWHIPLWFIAGMNQPYMHFGGFLLNTIGYSYIFSWFMALSGGRRFTGLYLHGLANAFIPFMPTIVLAASVAQPRYWIWTSSTLIIGVTMMLIRTKGKMGVRN